MAYGNYCARTRHQHENARARLLRQRDRLGATFGYLIARSCWRVNVLALRLLLERVLCARPGLAARLTFAFDLWRTGQTFPLQQ